MDLKIVSSTDGIEIAQWSIRARPLAVGLENIIMCLKVRQTLGKRKIDHIPILCNECPSCQKVSAKTPTKFRNMVMTRALSSFASRHHHESGATSFPSTSVTTINGRAGFVHGALRHISLLLLSSRRWIGGLALLFLSSVCLLIAVLNLFSLCVHVINLSRSRSIFDEKDSRWDIELTATVAVIEARRNLFLSFTCTVAKGEKATMLERSSVRKF
jgi:hypothetical protein